MIAPATGREQDPLDRIVAVLVHHDAPQLRDNRWGIDGVLYDTDHDIQQLQDDETRSRGYDSGLGP